MTKNIQCVKKEHSVRKAICIMAELSISCIVVEEGNRPTGIFTERDVTRLSNKETNLDNLKIEDIMSRPVITVSVDDSLHTVAKVMSQKNIRRIVVTDKDGNAEGLITQSDLIKGLETGYTKSLKALVLEKDKKLLEICRSLEEKSIYLDNILSSATEYAIITTDGDFRIAYCNPMVEKIFGYRPEDAIGKTVYEIHARENIAPERLRKAIKNVQKHGEHHFVMEKETGEGMRYIEMRISGIYDPDKKLVGYAHFSKEVTEQKKIEKNLKESEERYRMLIEGARVIGWEYDPVIKQFTFVSEKAEEITGYAPEKWYKKDFWTSHIHPKDRKSATEYCASSSEKCMDHEFEYRMLTANGEYLWVKDIVQVISEKGKPVMLRGVLIDVSELKQAEDALRKSEGLYLLLMDNINMGITYINTNYEVIMANRFQGSILKKLPREFIGKKCFNEFEKRDEVCSHCPGTIAMATGKPASVDTEGLLDDGSRVSAHINAFPVTDTDGYITGFVEVVEDIRERKKAEEKLKLFKDLLNQSDDSIAIIDVETGRFISINDTFFSRLGYSREELLKMRVIDIEAVIPDEFLWGKHVEELKDAVAMQLEGEHRRKDGSTFPVDVHTQYIAQGDTGYILAIARDITERKKAEDKLNNAYDELKKKSARLEKFQKVTVGREHDMIRMKKEVNELLEEMGKDKRY